MARHVNIDELVRVGAMVVAGRATHAEALELIDGMCGPDDGTPERDPTPAELRAIADSFGSALQRHLAADDPRGGRRDRP